MMVTKLDQVQHRYLLKQSPDVKLDQVANRYLIKDNTPQALDYALTPHQYLLNGLKNEMYLPVKERYITFSHPEATLGDPAFNSTVRLNVDRASGFKGYKLFKYNRTPVEHLIVDRDVLDTFRPPVGDIETTVDILRHFNSHYGTKIPLSDVVEESVESGSLVTFTVADGSFFFLPGTEVSLGVIKGGDRYTTLPVDTLSWSAEILEGIWTQGLDISTRHKGLTTGTTFTSALSNEFISQFYDDVALAPISTHPRLAGKALTVRSTAAPIISDRARTDCVNAVTIVPVGTTAPIIFHYDLRQR